MSEWVGEWVGGLVGWVGVLVGDDDNVVLFPYDRLRSMRKLVLTAIQNSNTNYNSYNTIQYNTIKYNTIQYNTILYYTIL